MKCPGCQNDAKKSTTYPDMYVCNCVGFLEDISRIPSKGGPTSLGNLRVIRLQTVDEVMEVGRALQNAAQTQNLAEQYFNDGSLFKVEQNGQVLYMVWIKPDRLIPGGPYFGKAHNISPDDADVANFKLMTAWLIAQGHLDPRIFSDTTHGYAKKYLGNG